MSKNRMSGIEIFTLFTEESDRKITVSYELTVYVNRITA